jgi:glycosyltransferase involved in cell wall biosynthesis
MRTLIIVPAFNEEKNIEALVTRMSEVSPLHVEVLVVNDHSTDGTAEVCRRLGVKMVDLPSNLGIGGAVQTGYKYAHRHRYDIAVQLDGDGQHPPEYLLALLQPIIDGQSDMVIGSRYIDKQGFQSSLIRRVGIAYFTWLIRLISGQHITDPTSGFRASNTRVIRLFAENYPQDYPEPESIVFLKRNRFRISEVPVVMSERQGGVSSISPLKSIYYMIKVSIAIVIDGMRKAIS